MPLSDKPYAWGGSAVGDCSGRMQKLAQQQQAGVSMEDMEKSMADDYRKVLDRMEDRLDRAKARGEGADQ